MLRGPQCELRIAAPPRPNCRHAGGVESDEVDHDTPSPCPARGVGSEQSTDPEYMYRSVCYCGHPRYFEYKISEAEAQLEDPVD